jgi:hypothetical protein
MFGEGFDPPGSDQHLRGPAPAIGVRLIRQFLAR